MKNALFLPVIFFLWSLTGCMLDPGLPSLPAVTVTSPASGDTVVGPVLSVTGTSSDGFGVEGVYVSLDGGAYSKVIGTANWATNYTNMGSSNHTIRAFAKGLGGLYSVTNTVNFFLTNYSFTPTNSWTVLIYLDGDNDLEYFAIWDFNEMETGILKAMNNGARDLMTNLSVIVLFDRSTSYASAATEYGGSDWYGTRLYRILPDADATYFGSELLSDGGAGTHHIAALGPTNMGSTNTLKWFIQYATNHFPAQNYALVLWDHGVAQQSICTDFYSGDALHIDEVRQSVSAFFTNTNKLGIIGFDACFMGTVEIAYEFRAVAKNLVASMYTEDMYGWNFDYWFGNLYGSRDVKSISAANFSRQAVEGYREYHESHLNDWGHTMSAVDLSATYALKTNIDLLASNIFVDAKTNGIETVRDASINYYHNSETASVDVPYYDIYDFCRRITNDSTYGFSASVKTAAQNVITALGNSVVYAYGSYSVGQNQPYYYGDGPTVKRGLSLFFGRGNKTYTADGTHVLKSASGTQSHFWFQWWYTSTNVSAWWGGHYYGNFDFCDSDSDGVVETWRELLKAWYDPTANVNTPGSY